MLFCKKKKNEEQIPIYSDISDKMRDKLLEMKGNENYQYYYEEHYGSPHFQFKIYHNIIHNISLYLDQLIINDFTSNKIIYSGLKVQKMFNCYYQEYLDKKQKREEESKANQARWRKEEEDFFTQHSDHLEDFF